MKKLIAVSAIALSGCTTIHFDRNGDSDLGEITRKQWHSNAIFALNEVSDPVKLDQACEDKDWTSVKTEQTFVNGLLEQVTYAMWSPKTVTISCK